MSSRTLIRAVYLYIIGLSGIHCFFHTTFSLHFAKGKRKFKGMYQYMYNHFAKILSGQYQYLNFEQDLGKLALRIAKSSYDPNQVLKKYRLHISR